MGTIWQHIPTQNDSEYMKNPMTSEWNRGGKLHKSCGFYLIRHDLAFCNMEFPTWGGFAKKIGGIFRTML